MALVTILMHFQCMRVILVLYLKILLGKLALLGKSEIRLELKLEH